MKAILSLPRFGYVLIIILGFLLYSKTLFYELTYLDDNVWLEDYGWLLKDFSNCIYLFKNPDLVSYLFYRPILSLSFMMDARWANQGFVVYHLTNVLIHAVNGCLVLCLLRKLGYQSGISLFFSCLFIVHPVLTQAVAWIPGRTDSLLALMILVSIVSFINSRERRKIVYFVVHLVFWIFALLVKETAVVLPVLCLLYDFLIAGTNKDNQRRWHWLLVWTVIWSAWFFLRKSILQTASVITFDAAAKSLAENSVSIITYFGKIILPFNLSVLPVSEDTTLVYGLIALVAVSLFVSIAKLKRLNYVLFGLAWFVLFIMPGLFLSFINHEYRLYLPMIGCIIILLEMDIFRSVDGILKRFFLGLMIFVLAVITFFYSNQFKDRWTFWKSAVKTSPHLTLAHRNLGAMYYLDGNMVLAREEYRKALALNPSEIMVHNNLGLIYMDQKMYPEAEQEYLMEIRNNPDYDNVYYNLGILYFRLEKWPLAEKAWLSVIKINPNFVDVYIPLVTLYITQKRYQEASLYIKELQKRGIEVPRPLLEGMAKAGY